MFPFIYGLFPIHLYPCYPDSLHGNSICPKRGLYGNLAGSPSKDQWGIFKGKILKRFSSPVLVCDISGKLVPIESVPLIDSPGNLGKREEDAGKLKEIKESLYSLAEQKQTDLFRMARRLLAHNGNPSLAREIQEEAWKLTGHPEILLDEDELKYALLV